MTVKFGAFVPQGWRGELAGIDDPARRYEAVVRCAHEAEAAGFDSIWVYDHFHTLPGLPPGPVFEAWTLCAALAAATKRMRIGQMVTCNEYRPPALLAKMASCVDVISGGRLIVGMGAGWYQEEAEAYGYDFGDMPDRLRRLGEAVEVMKAMWSGSAADFAGREFRVRGAINEPSARPPLWIGGGGEKVTLKLVARHAEGCNFGGDPDTIRHKLDVLERHCEAVGRDSSTITRSSSIESPFESSAQMAEEIRGRVEAGIDYVIVFVPDMVEGGRLTQFMEEVAPLVAG